MKTGETKMEKLTPLQKLRQLVIHRMTDDETEVPSSPADIDQQYELLCESDYDEVDEVQSDLRYAGIETGLTCEWSRHYESKAVAAQMLDGSWVGWTYWYGGGKHGNPGSIDWMEYSYDVEMREEVRVLQVFSAKQNADA